MSWYSPLVNALRPLLRKSDPTYGISAQFFSPGAPIYSSKDYRSFVSQGYRRCATVYTCINKIAGAASGIKWKLYTDQSMSREITSHPLLDLWKMPNPKQGTGAFVEQMFGYWHLAGNSYLYANRPNPNEPPVELWTLRPDLIKPVAGQNDVAGYVYGYGTSRARDFELGDIMHLKFPSYDDDFYGLSPIEVAMQLIDQQNEGNAWNTALMQNAGKPASVFFSKGYLTLEQRTQVRQELLKRYSGKRNAGMPMVLEADMTWQAMAMSPYELDWLQSRELNTREIASIFDVAPELVGDSAGKTFANQKEAKQSLYTENVLPKLDRACDHLNIWLVPMYPDLKSMGAWLTYDRKDIEVLAELYTAAQQQLSQLADNMWNNGEADLYTVQQMQGIKPDPNTKGLYKIGEILVRSQDLQAYAKQALQKPAAPPAPVPEPMLNQPQLGQPALPAPKPGTTVTEVPDGDNQDEQEDDTDENQPPAKKPGRGGKTPATTTAKRRVATEHKILDLSTREEKDAHAARIEAKRKAWEEKAKARVANYFQGERKAMVAAIKGSSTDTEADEQIQSVLDDQQDKLQTLIYGIWHDVGDDFGSEAAQQFADAKMSETRAARKDQDQQTQAQSIFTTQTVAYLLQLSATKVSQIDDTTLTSLRQALANGVAAGESIPEIATRVDQLYLQDIIPNRSETIARSEVVPASNWASDQAARQSGLTLKKTWLATDDSHTRPAHAEADGQTVGMDESFEVGGEELQYPGDPDGSAGNIINCRCTQYYQRVAAGSAGADADSEDDEAEEGKVVAMLPRRFKSVREFLEATA